MVITLGAHDMALRMQGRQEIGKWVQLTQHLIQNPEEKSNSTSTKKSQAQPPHRNQNWNESYGA